MNEQSDRDHRDLEGVHRRFGLWLLLSLAMLAGVAGLAALTLTGRMVAAPDWAAARIEARLNAHLAPAALRMDGVEVLLSRHSGAQVHFTGVTLLDGAGRDVLRLPRLEAALSPAALLAGQPALRRVALSGAAVTLRRAPDGRFDLALGAGNAPITAAQGLAELLDELDRALGAPALSGIEALSVESLSLTYEDARAGRLWRLQDGLLTLEQDAREVAMRAFFSLSGGAGRPAELALSFVSGKGSPEARFAANFSDLPAADLASQAPALAALALIDAPISGALRSAVDASGKLGPLNAALEIGAGLLRPPGGAPPIRFDAGKSYLTYDPDSRRLRFDQIALDTAVLRLRAEGHADLLGMTAGRPERMVGQLALRSVALDPAGMFERAAVFDDGAMDLQLDLEPLTFTVGQAVLLDGPNAYRMAGRVRARPEGWEVALDAAIGAITEDRLLALWPVELLAETRSWFAQNVIASNLHDVRVALRRAAGGDTRMTLDHAFRDTEVRFLDTMPPVTGGAGYATLDETSYTLVAESGLLRLEGGEVLDLSGSVMHLRDITADPVQARFDLSVDSSIPAALRLLDLPPLGVTSGVGLDPLLAQGRASLRTMLRLPLRDRLAIDEVEYAVDGRLRAVRSDTLIPGRRLEADELRITATPQEVRLNGAVRVDGLPVSGSWSRRTGQAGASRVEARVDLSQETAVALGLGLPDGTLQGRAEGALVLDLPRGAAPRFALEADLKGLGLRLPGLDWRKAADSPGTLTVAGTLRAMPQIERLEFSAPGLDAEGQLRLDAARGAELRLDRLRVGGWLDASAVVGGLGEGQTLRVALTGGTADLRGIAEGRDPLGMAGGTSAGGPAIDIALDRLRVSDQIGLTDLRGRLSWQGGMNGRFSALAGGRTPVTITMTPDQTGGTALRLRSEAGGEALRDAGLFPRARGGTLEIVMRPAGEPGHYDGRLMLRDTRLRGMPVLTELLSAVSVVGILEMMEGDGLAFANVEARFTLTPEMLEIRKGSAIGPSLGISLDGIYGFKDNRLDMRGVISPLYMVNFIGSVLTRQGEGLFGFSFRIKGDANAPQTFVNPLSILTPGMFREIFRGAPPKGPQ
ncbi:YhdP family protein [Rhodovulum adriaticum]|uniref:AsmA-like protein n=1 Tax=Rhodovulum adriaticum TaxID=35804 RepID=A0A4V2SLE4_RHOAD|nr:AsmA-like C-terminal region-containing protein [Rhodovulum adriaticum]MBK1634555.1 hypothetical protein [Rhodovulum adriaticum]TCP23076.1 AsmA-like protein [Rhodovulum adriaticum]